MPRARKHIVCLSETPYYHVTSRCVRRAFLCGVDRDSGRSYEHRRGWIENRLRVLSSLFSVHLCAWAVMSNHYHIVVRLNPAESDALSDDEVLTRWTSLFRGPLLVQRCVAGEPMSTAETAAVSEIAAVYRRRLGSLSWFMKCLNEPIAREANAEDGCTGHFWEARFHSQPLRSEAALLTAMTYVDLNPVRAGIAETPEESEYTGIRARIRGEQRDLSTKGASASDENMDTSRFVRPPMPFADEATDGHQFLPMRKHEYLKLVDQTGRVAVRGKRGTIDSTLLPILARLGFTAKDWLLCSTRFRQYCRQGEIRLARSA